MKKMNITKKQKPELLLKEMNEYAQIALMPYCAKQTVHNIYSLACETNYTTNDKIDINNLRSLLLDPDTKGACAYVLLDHPDEVSILTLLYEHYIANKKVECIKEEIEDLLNARLQTIQDMFADTTIINNVKAFYDKLMPQKLEQFNFSELNTEKSTCRLQQIKCLALLHAWLRNESQPNIIQMREHTNCNPIQFISSLMGYRVTLNEYSATCNTLKYENGIEDAINLYLINGTLAMLINKLQYGSQFDLPLRVQNVYQLATYFKLGEFENELDTGVGNLELRYLTTDQPYEEYYRNAQEWLENPKKVYGIHIIDGFPIKVVKCDNIKYI